MSKTYTRAHATNLKRYSHACDHCVQVFSSARPDSAYCSAKCREAARRKRRGEEAVALFQAEQRKAEEKREADRAAELARIAARSAEVEQLAARQAEAKKLKARKAKAKKPAARKRAKKKPAARKTVRAG